MLLGVRAESEVGTGVQRGPTDPSARATVAVNRTGLDPEDGLAEMRVEESQSLPGEEERPTVEDRVDGETLEMEMVTEADPVAMIGTGRVEERVNPLSNETASVRETGRVFVTVAGADCACGKAALERPDDTEEIDFQRVKEDEVNPILIPRLRASREGDTIA